jgi:hypothetical protein
MKSSFDEARRVAPAARLLPVTCDTDASTAVTALHGTGHICRRRDAPHSGISPTVTPGPCLGLHTLPTDADRAIAEQREAVDQRAPWASHAERPALEALSFAISAAALGRISNNPALVNESLRLYTRALH